MSLFLKPLNRMRGQMTVQTNQFVIKISETKNRSVFTTANIVAGSEVMEFRGEYKKSADITDTTHCMQMDKDLYLTASGFADDYVNHSCIPNCGLMFTTDKRIILFALNDIPADTELTFDYSTCLSGMYEKLECFCETAKCRKLVGGFKDLDQDLKTFYIERNAVLPYLLSDL